MSNSLLFSLIVLIWGTTWYAIKLQLGVVDPVVSVAYRFFIAAFVLFLWIKWRGLPIRFNLKQHLIMVLLGFLMFSTNYILTYIGTGYLTSGLVAVVFALITVMNVVNSSIFFKIKPESSLILGIIMGFGGIIITFWHEISNFSLSNAGSLGLIICLIATLSASLGNMVAMGSHKRGFPILQTNAFGMLYGAILTAIWAVIGGKSFAFDTSPVYVITLVYLAIPGSVIAFQCYLTLASRIGAGKASYSAVVIPVFALVISTIFEDYHWPIETVVGMMLVVTGTIMILNKKIPAYLFGAMTSSIKKLRRQPVEAKIIVDN